MNSALGLIETQGLVGLVYAIDAMLKAASVELASSIIKLDGGIVSVMVRGDVSSVRAAVEAQHLVVGCHELIIHQETLPITPGRV